MIPLFRYILLSLGVLTLAAGVVFVLQHNTGPESITHTGEAPETAQEQEITEDRQTVSENTPEEETRSVSENNEERARLAGRLLIVGFRGTHAAEESYMVRLVRDVQPGGVIIFDRDVPSRSFPRNIESPTQLRTLIASLQQLSPYPLIIAVDAEGGAVNRLRAEYGFIDVPSHKTLGDRNDTTHTYNTARSLALQLADLGFTMNFAPVVDVNITPQNPIIGALGRSFSSDASAVTDHARAFLQAHKDTGVLPVLKHFPGHGSATGDTHLGVVDVTSTWKDKELLPYQELIQEGYTSPIMTAHIINRNVGPLPATLSREYLTNILRAELGFTGVIITDDLDMGAIRTQFGLEEAAVRAIEAGADMLIISNNVGAYDPSAPYRVRDAIIKAVAEGRLSHERLEQSVRRIQQMTEEQ